MEFLFIYITQLAEIQKLRHLYGFMAADSYVEVLVSFFVSSVCSKLLASVKPMTDDPSSPSKKLVRETRTRNSVRMSCILARVFTRARNLFQVGHSSVPSEKLGVT